MKLAGHAAHTGKYEIQKFCLKNQKERDHLGESGLHGKIVKLILMN
jgi:hypothetical protein